MASKPNDLRVPCLKCKKPSNLNSTGICKDCRSAPCKKCGVMTTSKVFMCYPCSKPGQYKKKQQARLKKAKLKQEEANG